MKHALFALLAVSIFLTTGQLITIRSIMAHQSGIFELRRKYAR